jgi:hypothetical protein
VCEIFTDLNDPARGEPLHKIFMAKFPDHTNQGTPSQGDSCAFPFFRNVGVPLMATFYIPGLNVGLLVWLGTIPNVPNALDTSQLSALSHGNNVDVSSSGKASPPPSPAFGESTITSNRKSKRSRKRKNRKKNSQTSASHVGDGSKTFVSHVEDQHPPFTSHAGVIDSFEKPRRIGCKPKFPCNIFKGDHLTHLCFGLPKVRRLWSLSASSSDSESSEVFSQYFQPLVEKVVMSIQTSADPTPLLGAEVPLYLVVS